MLCSHRQSQAVELQGEDVLAQTVRDVAGIMRRNATTDWTVRDDVRAKLRSSIKRLLVKYKYPPDKQPETIRLVIEQTDDGPRYRQGSPERGWLGRNTAWRLERTRATATSRR
ncbi:type I restriction enzyme endonuclease domain-containing protein [Saccharopolyspora sp. 5N708]|uniref:type I restriction enzyme endonuclease domain-containing protein n=1 Tax=Saccharopolyspora sp. 5N708 TaxID=3457424 RepID=UPI003FD3A660